jgi:hypothetical protein
VGELLASSCGIPKTPPHPETKLLKQYSIKLLMHYVIQPDFELKSGTASGFCLFCE